MREYSVAVRTHDGTMETFVVRPDGEDPCPVVLVYMDALGIREELREMARRTAAAGYHVLMPNLFYRAGGPSFDASGLPERVDPRMHELNHATTLAMVRADTGAVLAHAAADPIASTDAVGCIGYCMGGRHALTAAAAYPDRVGAAASVHGGFLVTDRPDSPHLAMAEIRAELYLAFAEDDPVAPATSMDVLRESMTRCGVAGEVELLAGCAHGFVFPERYCYDERAAEHVWGRWLAMLARNL